MSGSSRAIITVCVGPLGCMTGTQFSAAQSELLHADWAAGAHPDVDLAVTHEFLESAESIVAQWRPRMALIDLSTSVGPLGVFTGSGVAEEKPDSGVSALQGASTGTGWDSGFGGVFGGASAEAGGWDHPEKRAAASGERYSGDDGGYYGDDGGDDAMEETRRRALERGDGTYGEGSFGGATSGFLGSGSTGSTGSYGGYVGGYYAGASHGGAGGDDEMGGFAAALEEARGAAHSGASPAGRHPDEDSSGSGAGSSKQSGSPFGSANARRGAPCLAGYSWSSLWTGGVPQGGTVSLPAPGPGDSFSVYGDGRTALEGGSLFPEEQRDEVGDSVRKLLEAADGVQGIVLLGDASGAWGGLSVATAEAIRDEAPKSAMLSVLLGDGVAADDEDEDDGDGDDAGERETDGRFSGGIDGGAGAYGAGSYSSGAYGGHGWGVSAEPAAEPHVKGTGVTSGGRQWLARAGYSLALANLREHSSAVVPLSLSALASMAQAQAQARAAVATGRASKGVRVYEELHALPFLQSTANVLRSSVVQGWVAGTALDALLSPCRRASSSGTSGGVASLSPSTRLGQLLGGAAPRSGTEILGLSVAAPFPGSTEGMAAIYRQLDAARGGPVPHGLPARDMAPMWHRSERTLREHQMGLIQGAAHGGAESGLHPPVAHVLVARGVGGSVGMVPRGAAGASGSAAPRDRPAVTPADHLRGASGSAYAATPQWDKFMMRSRCRFAAHCSLPRLPCPLSGRAAPRELLVAGRAGPSTGSAGSSASGVTSASRGLLTAWGHVPRHARLGELARPGAESAWSFKIDVRGERPDGTRPPILREQGKGGYMPCDRGVQQVPRGMPVLAHLQSGPAMLGYLKDAARAFDGWRHRPEAARIGGGGGHAGTGVADAASGWMQEANDALVTSADSVEPEGGDSDSDE